MFFLCRARVQQERNCSLVSPMTEVTLHPFGCILCVISRSPGSPPSRGGNYTQLWGKGRGSLRTCPESYFPQTLIQDNCILEPCKKKKRYHLILKDYTVKVLHSICQQIWKTQHWPQDWKRSVFIPIPKKGAKECSNTAQLHSSYMLVK